MSARTCTDCGAPAPRDEARFCEQCGAALAPPAPPPDVFGDISARFRALESHPELARLLASTPDVPELAGKTLPSVLAVIGLAALGVFASVPLLGFCPPLGFALFAVVIVGAIVLLRKLIWSARTPLVARTALVVSKRAKLMAGAEHSPAHTRHLVTLQASDGTRSEHECYASALSTLTPGALGVAHLKGEILVAFEVLSPPLTAP